MSTNVSVTLTLTRGQWRILRALLERLLEEPRHNDAERVLRRLLETTNRALD